jgi:hypothetical protein
MITSVSRAADFHVDAFRAGPIIVYPILLSQRHAGHHQRDGGLGRDVCLGTMPA